MLLLRPLILLTLLLALAVPGTAAAVDGFDNLKFGMTPQQAQDAYGGRLKTDRDKDGAPEGSVGDALVLEDATLFEERVEVKAYFDAGGLSVIRLSFNRPKDGNLDQVRASLEQGWGQGIVTRGRLAATRHKKEWTWPWEGAQLREVKDDGAVVYQRLDFSAEMRRRWIAADAEVCSVLPTSSKCPFADRYCPVSSSEVRREHEFVVADSAGTVRCGWTDGRLTEVRIEVGKPDDSAADWLLAILSRRLGNPNKVDKSDGGDEVLETVVWGNHGIELRLVRKAEVQTKSGWTGPVKYLRIERAIGGA